MADETEIGPSGAPDRRGHPRGGSGEQSPLQARAEFLKNRSWELVVGLNRGACARGGAQHGFNRETQAACASEWAAKQGQVLSLNETIDFQSAPAGALQRMLDHVFKISTIVSSFLELRLSQRCVADRAEVEVASSPPSEGPACATNWCGASFT